MLATVHAAQMERFLFYNRATREDVAPVCYPIDSTSVRGGSPFATISTRPRPTPVREPSILEYPESTTVILIVMSNDENAKEIV